MIKKDVKIRDKARLYPKYNSVMNNFRKCELNRKTLIGLPLSSDNLFYFQTP